MGYNTNFGDILKSVNFFITIVRLKLFKDWDEHFPGQNISNQFNYSDPFLLTVDGNYLFKNLQCIDMKNRSIYSSGDTRYSNMMIEECKFINVSTLDGYRGGVVFCIDCEKFVSNRVCFIGCKILSYYGFGHVFVMYGNSPNEDIKQAKLHYQSILNCGESKFGDDLFATRPYQTILKHTNISYSLSKMLPLGYITKSNSEISINSFFNNSGIRLGICVGGVVKLCSFLRNTVEHEYDIFLSICEQPTNISQCNIIGNYISCIFNGYTSFINNNGDAKLYKEYVEIENMRYENVILPEFILSECDVLVYKICEKIEIVLKTEYHIIPCSFFSSLTTISTCRGFRNT